MTGDYFLGLPDLALFCGQGLLSGDPSNCPLKADFADNNCFISLADYIVLAGEWPKSGNFYDGLPKCAKLPPTHQPPRPGGSPPAPNRRF